MTDSIGHRKPVVMNLGCSASSAELDAPFRVRSGPQFVLLDPMLRWIDAPYTGRVDIDRRPVIRRVLAALLACRARGAERGLSMREVFEAGWPGEKATPHSAANRVYVTIARIRRLGLGEHLCTTARGFSLAPTVRLADRARGVRARRAQP